VEVSLAAFANQITCQTNVASIRPDTRRLCETDVLAPDQAHGPRSIGPDLTANNDFESAYAEISFAKMKCGIVDDDVVGRVISDDIKQIE